MKKGFLRNFTEFTGKHPCQTLFFNKVADLRNNPISITRSIDSFIKEKVVVKSCKRSRFFVVFITHNLNPVIQPSLVLLKLFGN